MCAAVYVFCWGVSRVSMLVHSTDMLQTPKSLSPAQEFHTYIARSTELSPGCLPGTICFRLFTGSMDLSSLSPTLLPSDFSFFVALPSANLPSKEPGLLNMHLSPVIHLESVTSSGILFQMYPFWSSWYHSLSTVSHSTLFGPLYDSAWPLLHSKIFLCHS